MLHYIAGTPHSPSVALCCSPSFRSLWTGPPREVRVGLISVRTTTLLDPSSAATQLPKSPELPTRQATRQELHRSSHTTRDGQGAEAQWTKHGERQAGGMQACCATYSQGYRQQSAFAALRQEFHLPCASPPPPRAPCGVVRASSGPGVFRHGLPHSSSDWRT